MENYEKLYKEALERAQKIYKADKITGIELVTCETIFPELAESEDEKIRKDIIYVLANIDLSLVSTKFSDMLAWLEKQGEQKPTEWSEEDKKMLENAIYLAENSKCELTKDKTIDWLKSLKPQSHWKPSEEQLECLKETIVQTKGYTYSWCLPELYEKLKKL